GFRRVRPDEVVARLQGVVVRPQRAGHRAGAARRPRGDVAIHLGVVGVFELARVQPPEQPRHGYDRETNTDPQPRVRLFRRFGGRFLFAALLGTHTAIALAPPLLELLFGHFDRISGPRLGCFALGGR